MAIDDRFKGLNDRDRNRFVESPTRAGEPAVEVVIGGGAAGGGPIEFVLDSTDTQVEKDTATPANNIPLPVELLDTSGVIDARTALENLDVDLSTRASETTLSTLNAKFTDGTDIGDVTVNNAAGASAVNIQDGGNSITVDAVDLDIRDLDHTQDDIRLGDGTNLTNVTANNDLQVADFGNDTGQRNTITVGTTAIAISTVGGVPLADRKVVRLVPVDNGQFYWGFSSGVTSSNAERFTRNSPITLSIGDNIDVFLIRASGSGDVAIYEVS